MLASEHARDEPRRFAGRDTDEGVDRINVSGPNHRQEKLVAGGSATERSQWKWELTPAWRTKTGFWRIRTRPPRTVRLCSPRQHGSGISSLDRPGKRGGFLLPCELMSDDRLVFLMVAITGLSVLIALSMLATLVLR
jgi:hypothetical protein